MDGFRNYFEQLNEHNEVQMPRLFSELKKYKNHLVGIHFSNSDQISFNPMPSHHDPIGVYTFPKKYVEDEGLRKNAGFSKMPNIFILEPTYNAHVLNLNMNEQEAKNILVSMGIPREFYDDAGVRTMSRGEHPGHIFWSAIEGWRHKYHLTKNSSWNALFKKTGFNVLYDPGLSIIHSNEPSQVVYLEPKTFKVLNIIKNNLAAIISLIGSAFPDYKVINKNFKKTRSGFGEYSEYLFTDSTSEKYFVISIHSNTNSISITSCGGQRLDYSYAGDIKNIVNDIKQALENCEIDSKTKEDISNSPIQEIAKLYGLSLKEGQEEISRNYRVKEHHWNGAEKFHIVNVHLNYNPSTKYSLVSTLNLNFSKKREKEMYSFGDIDNYSYHAVLENPKNDPKESMNILLNRLESRIRLDLESDSFELQHKAKGALKDFLFIRKRVFQPKNH